MRMEISSHAIFIFFAQMPINVWASITCPAPLGSLALDLQVFSIYMSGQWPSSCQGIRPGKREKNVPLVQKAYKFN